MGNDKLTHTISLKVTEEVAKRISGMASLEGMDGSSEWCGHCVLQSLEQHDKRRAALNAIFEPPTEESKEYHSGHGLPRSHFHG